MKTVVQAGKGDCQKRGDLQCATIRLPSSGGKCIRAGLDVRAGRGGPAMVEAFGEPEAALDDSPTLSGDLQNHVFPLRPLLCAGMAWLAMDERESRGRPTVISELWSLIVYWLKQPFSCVGTLAYPWFGAAEFPIHQARGRPHERLQSRIADAASNITESGR